MVRIHLKSGRVYEVPEGVLKKHIHLQTKKGQFDKYTFPTSAPEKPATLNAEPKKEQEKTVEVAPKAKAAEEKPKPKRKRRTKAEIEAAKKSK